MSSIRLKPTAVGASIPPESDSPRRLGDAGVLREAAGRYPRGASVSVLVGLLASNGPWAISEGF